MGMNIWFMTDGSPALRVFGELLAVNGVHRFANISGTFVSPSRFA